MSHSMKGRTPTAAEKAYMDRLVTFGCWACNIEGRINMDVLIHHSDGRTKPNAHKKTIPLCFPHHDYSVPGSVHHNQARFEEKFGKQEKIVAALLNYFGETLDG